MTFDERKQALAAEYQQIAQVHARALDAGRRAEIRMVEIKAQLRLLDDISKGQEQPA